jgi:hypothetical protein
MKNSILAFLCLSIVVDMYSSGPTPLERRRNQLAHYLCSGYFNVRLDRVVTRAEFQSDVHRLINESMISVHFNIASELFLSCLKARGYDLSGKPPQIYDGSGQEREVQESFLLYHQQLILLNHTNALRAASRVQPVNPQQQYAGTIPAPGKVVSLPQAPLLYKSEYDSQIKALLSYNPHWFGQA